MASADDDPARKAEMADSLSLAFLVLLESLSPEQRGKAPAIAREIQGVSSIVNPGKLRHLGPVADLRALLRKRS